MQGTWVLSLSGKILHAEEQLSQCATTTEPTLSSPGVTTPEAQAHVLHNKKRPRNEKTAHRN